MARVLILFALIAVSAESALGMDCSFGQSRNIIEKVLRSCPGPLDRSEKAYCCIDVPNETFYCCDETEYLLKVGIGIVVPVIITAAIVISLLVCCISCLCCSCCPWYRRRHRGTVYGRMQTPTVVHVVQTPPVSQQVPYQTQSTGIPQPPPPYSEHYGKQAPYNPDFRN